MILAIIGYGLVVGVLVGLAAWLVERAQLATGRPRKYAWMGGISAALLVPLLVMAVRQPGEGAVIRLTAITDTQVQGAARVTGIHETAASPGGEADRGTLNGLLAALWALASALLLLRYGFSAWHLERRSRHWRRARVDASLVHVAPDLGPAVFGWRRASIVFPDWLVQAPRIVQRLALAHEREHIAARDPQILAVATLLAALLPWNLPLIWMLRRMRFAMEVDCDTRVIRRGIDPNDYGLALLYVSERQSRAPITAIALIERKSQLEQRIHFMFTTPRKHRAWFAGACLAIAAGSLFAAAQVQAPDLGAAKVILKPPPGTADDPGTRLGEKFELLLRERYPELLRGEFTRTPVVVVLLNDDMTTANSAQIESIEDDRALKTTPDVFAVLGLAPDQVPYTGAMNMQIAPGSAKHVVMLYTERGLRGPAFVSRLFPDTRKLDRELFEREFPGTAGEIAAGHDPWLLIDRKGVVLRKGLEPIAPQFDEALRARYAGIATQEMTVTNLIGAGGVPMRDVTGRNIHLHVVWLAPGSPAPQN